eukprot:5857487-Prymnesium_polylepis.1
MVRSRTLPCALDAAPPDCGPGLIALCTAPRSAAGVRPSHPQPGRPRGVPAGGLARAAGVADQARSRAGPHPASDRQQVGTDVERRAGAEARVLPARALQPEACPAAGRALPGDRARKLPAAGQAEQDPRAVTQPDAQDARVGRRRAAHGQPGARDRPLRAAEHDGVWCGRRADIAQHWLPAAAAGRDRGAEPEAGEAAADEPAD